MPDPPDRPNRLEREIDEILSKIERFPSARQRRAHAQRRWLRRVGNAVSARQQALMRELSRISLSQVMLLSFLLILASFFVRRALPIAWPWLMYAGAVLFLASFGLMLLGRSTGRSAPRRYWRGRLVSYAPTLSQRLRRWWDRRPPR
ncbi:MAG: hypothetical protein FJ035_09280 [Chloroflexi bacterium]|nr:hypothetical protein [Chloroflexota bacterium]